MAGNTRGLVLGRNARDRSPSVSPGSLDLNSPKFPSQQYPGASDRYVTSVTSLLRHRKTRESVTGADVTSVTCVTWKKMMGNRLKRGKFRARQPPYRNGQVKVK